MVHFLQPLRSLNVLDLEDVKKVSYVSPQELSSDQTGRFSLGLQLSFKSDNVDGSEIRRSPVDMVNFPSFCWVLTSPGGAEFLPTVVLSYVFFLYVLEFLKCLWRYKTHRINFHQVFELNPAHVKDVSTKHLMFFSVFFPSCFWQNNSPQTKKTASKESKNILGECFKNLDFFDH